MLEIPSVLTNNQGKTVGALPPPRWSRRGVDLDDIFLAWDYRDNLWSSDPQCLLVGAYVTI